MYNKDIEFEWDDAKSHSNSEKHGISFPEAMALWDDEGLIEIHLPYPYEPRWVVIGRMGELCFAAIITRRMDKIRIISVRRARKNEERYYDDRCNGSVIG